MNYLINPVYNKKIKNLIEEVKLYGLFLDVGFLPTNHIYILLLQFPKICHRSTNTRSILWRGGVTLNWQRKGFLVLAPVVFVWQLCELFEQQQIDKPLIKITKLVLL